MESVQTNTVLIGLAVAVILTIIIVYYMNSTAKTAEKMINPMLQLKVTRGLNESNASGYTGPIMQLSALEHSNVGSFGNTTFLD